MKKLVLLFALVLSVASFANTGAPKSTEATKEIRTKIVKLLGKAEFEVKKEIKTTVEFLINKKGELVIVNLDCSNENICAFVKSKLNYKKVTSTNKFKGVKVYKMPLKIVK